MNPNTQIEDVLYHLKKFKTITKLEAANLYGVYCLAQRIADLRAEGYKIENLPFVVTNRRGRVSRPAKYFLNEK